MISDIFSVGPKKHCCGRAMEHTRPLRKRYLVKSASIFMLLELLIILSVFDLTTNNYLYYGVEAAVFGGNKPAHSELYSDLGVEYDASAAEIRKAFRALARKHHPDLKETFVEKEAAKEIMAKILRAYEVLSDEEKRSRYDESGYIAGEAVNIHDMSAEELFEHYHQVLPIISRTPTLNSKQLVDRVMRFRGTKVFLINIYEDTCSECRFFATAWETLAHSPLAESHVLEMYRIDAASRDGKPLLKDVKVRYKNKQYVVAIVDGEIWPFYELADVLKGKNGGVVYKTLLDFVMSFFHDSESLLPLSSKALLPVADSPNSASSASATASATSSLLQWPKSSSKNKHAIIDKDFIVKYLKQPRSSEHSTTLHKPAPIKILFPSSNIAGVALPLALQLRHEQMAEVHTVERKSLLSFVEDYCDMEVEVRNRAGDLLPAPEFFVISTQRLPEEEEEEEEEESVVAADSENEDDENNEMEHSCRGIHIGASVSLDYTKASKYLEEFIPHPFESTKTITHIDTAMTFYDVCNKNCLLWLRPTCNDTDDHSLNSNKVLSQVNDTALIYALSQNYLSFNTGFVCLDEHTALHNVLGPVIVENIHKHQSHTGILAAMMDYDDTKLYILPTTHKVETTGDYEVHHTEQSTTTTSTSNSDSNSDSNHKPHSATSSSTPSTTKITGRVISGLLAMLLEHKAVPHSSITEVDLNASMEGLLNATPFPLHKLQRYYLMSSGIFRNARPLITNILPFFLMYLVHTKIINPYRDSHGRNNNTNNNNTSSSRSQGRNNRNGSANQAAGDNAELPPAGVPGVRRFVPTEDIKEALTGKGFLILIDDNRPVLKGTLPLPLIANDSRFTVRVIGLNEVQWKEWIRAETHTHAEHTEKDETKEVQEQKEADACNEQSNDNTNSNTTNTTNTSTETSSEQGVNVLAIRKQRMKAIVKREDEDLSTFLHDLIDGTVVPSMEIPPWMKKVK